MQSQKKYLLTPSLSKLSDFILLGYLKYLLILAFNVWVINYTLSQTTFDYPYNKQRNLSLGINVGTSALIGGIGAAIHKSETDKTWKVFVKGFAYGALGGGVNFVAKSSTHLIHKNQKLTYAWYPKFIGSIGASIVENASTNRHIWESYHLNVGPVRLEIDNKNHYAPRVKLLPAAALGTIYAFTQGKFNLKYTIQTGTPFFTSPSTSFMHGYEEHGATYINAIRAVPTDDGFFRSSAHEYVHVLQYEDFIGINSFYSGFLSKKELLPKWIYLDAQVLTYGTLYWIMRHPPGPCYYNNYLEREAESLATRMSILNCIN